MTIGKSTGIAVDKSILARLDQIMPSYYTRKSFVNKLLDDAVTELEQQQGFAPSASQS